MGHWWPHLVFDDAVVSDRGLWLLWTSSTMGACFRWYTWLGWCIWNKTPLDLLRTHDIGDNETVSLLAQQELSKALNISCYRLMTSSLLLYNLDSHDLTQITPPNILPENLENSSTKLYNPSLSLSVPEFLILMETLVRCIENEDL